MSRCRPRPWAICRHVKAFPTEFKAWTSSLISPWKSGFIGEKSTWLRAMTASSQPGLRVIHILVNKRKSTIMVVMVKRTQSKMNITGPRFVPSFEVGCSPLPIFAWFLGCEHGHQVFESFRRHRGDKNALSPAVGLQ